MKDPLVGQMAPVLEAVDSEGEKVAFLGRWTVLFFFPKAYSPGCTLQTWRYASLMEEFQKLGAQVFGVSQDGPGLLCRFGGRFGLRTLPDPQGTLARAFGVGRFLGLVRRDTLVLDPEGRVAAAFRGVNPLTDPERVLAFLRRAVLGKPV